MEECWKNKIQYILKFLSAMVKGKIIYNHFIKTKKYFNSF